MEKGQPPYPTMPAPPYPGPPGPHVNMGYQNQPMHQPSKREAIFICVILFFSF